MSGIVRPNNSGQSGIVSNIETINSDDYVDASIDNEHLADNAVGTAEIADDAVTAAKLANSINTEIAANTAKTGITGGQSSAITANTAKVTNATHTGDVTGGTALTIATDAVDIAMLSATGTASSSTFLRGDNAWAVVASAITREGGNSTEATTTSTTAVDILAAASLTIAAQEIFTTFVILRKTSGAGANVKQGGKLNSTIIWDAANWFNTTNEEQHAIVYSTYPARISSYLSCCPLVLRKSTRLNGSPISNDIVGVGQINDLPTVEVTDYVARGEVDNASNTLGMDELQVYSYISS
jgi:hypothetical protein